MKLCLILRQCLIFSLLSSTCVRATNPVVFKDAVKTASLQQLKQIIENIVPVQKKDLRAGLLVVSLTTKEILYSHDADELLMPASVSKLFTAYAALKKMKSTATFRTEIYAKGPVVGGILSGDLYLRGGGDPSLVSERMWMLVNELLRSGIKSIHGSIYADSSFFDEEKTPDSRPKYLKDQAYNAPVGALSFNFNTTTIYVRPGETPNLPPVVYIDPENPYVDVVNQATTGKAGSNNTIAVNRTDYVKGDIGDTVLLRGSIPVDGHELRFYKNIVNPALYTAHMFKTFWEKRGMTFVGNVKEGTVPSDARKILDFDSLPLWQIVWGMNKFSNNFVADQILKKLGAEMWGPPGTRQKGLTAMADALEDIGILPKTYSIIDGSGLTRGTKVTARQIVAVLGASHRDFGIAPEMIASLGIAGEDGTLRRRFPNSAAEKNVLRAKTGSLDGVNSLAGFTPTADGELLAFAIILNDPKTKFGRMTAWIDPVADALARFSRK